MSMMHPLSFYEAIELSYASVKTPQLVTGSQCD